MSTATISPGDHLAIPLEFRRALHLSEGAKVILSVEDGKLIVQAGHESSAVLEQGRYGRPVLRASPDAPAMTPEQVKSILEDS